MDNSLLAVRDINHKYIVVEGRMFIPLDKNGFIDGNAETFKKFIDGKIKK
jgi:hypothetical protein